MKFNERVVVVVFVVVDWVFDDVVDATVENVVCVFVVATVTLDALENDNVVVISCFLKKAENLSPENTFPNFLLVVKIGDL